MTIDFIACPKCGNRVDEDDERGDVGRIPSVAKRLTGGGQWATRVQVPYCPHCGTLLAIIIPQPPQ
jgi:hypothetical protein